ncbi:nuclear transport factor 2 family protein [Sphingomonas sp. PP-F2F-G114-C0414]|uniref:nuclear transport factor 2 family protein n=1 Tax=Sphingomonas sp. PP-F2F-G114-C0414 TaxID=2135662 RepID=UPI000EF8CB41|nr:nuclear transport factor 2 family protein [Sphingomonas sp. PP-F2F-G114-C0414]
MDVATSPDRSCAAWQSSRACHAILIRRRSNVSRIHPPSGPQELCQPRHRPALQRGWKPGSRRRAIFAGNSAIGGARRGPAAFVRWLERVYRLLPDLKFEVQDVIVSGGPFNTRVAVHWQSSAKSVTGDPYVNDGVHLIRMSKGRITHIHVFTDTEVIASTMAAVAGKGIEEAAALPLG